MENKKQARICYKKNMDIKSLKKLGKLSKDTWNELADQDAEFYILTERDRKGKKWDKKEFLEKGQEQWERFKELLYHYGLEGIAGKNKIALDMGCGVGRMTFAMAKDFWKVIGVDVSEVMVNKAREYQKKLAIKNVEFLVNNGIDLSQFSDNSIDFVFSYLTLQHCPSSKQVLRYIKEFSRITKPSGCCLFQTRIAPTLKRYARFVLSKKLARIKRLFIKDYYLKNAFIGNWIYYPVIYKVVKNNFSSFYLLQTPIELYHDRFWDLKHEYERWKRSFWICIK